MVQWFSLQCVVVELPGHTHLLFGERWLHFEPQTKTKQFNDQKCQVNPEAGIGDKRRSRDQYVCHSTHIHHVGQAAIRIPRLSL